MPSKQNRSQCVAVFLILLCAYVLVFSGTTSTDDEQLFIALSENIANGRDYSALPLFGNDRLQGQAGGVEPLHPLIGVPFYKIAHHYGLGKVHILYLLPAVYTALTGTLLVRIAECKGSPPNTAAFLGIVYGLGTIALPYARMNFRESLAALLITTTVLFLEYSRTTRDHTWKQFFYSFFTLIFLGLAVLTKITAAVIVPFFILIYLTQPHIWKKENRTQTVKAVLAVMALLISTGFFIWRFLPDNSLSRYTLRFFNYISYTLPRLPHDHFWPAMAGLLFSPGKGLIVYSPVLILSLVSPFLKRIKRVDWIIYMGALLALTAVQALIYNERWWSISWGTRALLPALPLATLAALPALHEGFNHPNKRIRGGMILLVILGLCIQIGRLLVPDPVYANWLVQFTAREIGASAQWIPHLMPLFRHWQLAFNGYSSDILWLYISSSIWPAILTILLAFAGIAFGVILLTRKENKHSFWIIAVLICIIILMLTPISARTDHRYFGEVPVFNDALSGVCAAAGNSDLILIDAYLKPFWWCYLNFGCSGPEWIGLPYIHKTAIFEEQFYPRTAELAALIRARLKDGGQVFLIQSTQGEAPSHSDMLDDLGFAHKRKITTKDHGLKIFLVE